ncbi:O-antigen translocase [Crateriforma conspicua]|uniref:O-antigen translocase n=1 Tax=Crateriforma conspicua TaxID=2527996 RepID=UPI0011893F1F|nr:O-antigen translocase [Crateriforma conspicua]QDV65936.1 colanic acid exporter [Crateriforma conspicua]
MSVADQRAPEEQISSEHAISNVEESKSEQSSYGQILKSSSIVGGAQVINMGIGLVRTKLVAVLIGPAGIGLVGVYLSITALANTLAGMGIQTSGVRDVAKHHGDGNAEAVAATVITLRRVCWLTGIAGAAILAAAAPWISQTSFGSNEYTLPVALLGITVFLSNLAGGQSAILQGTRRIGDLARVQVLGAILGTLVSVGLYAWLGMAGIVPALIALSAISLLVSTHYSRKIPLAPASVTWRQSLVDAGGLLKFGASMVVAGLVGAGATYAIRAILSNQLDLQAVGIYTAAFTLSGMFVKFVLQAMGADFYPRLTAVSDDHAAMRRLINEQTKVGLLLAFPGLLATLALAPWVIALFYTSEFAPAAEMLKWFVIGCMGRVLSWPLGFALLAKGQGKLFATTETVFQAFHVLMVVGLIHGVGLLGAAIAFAALYFAHTAGMLAITRQTIGFLWSRSVLTQLAWMVPVAATVFSCDLILPPVASTAAGALTTVAATILCLRHLVTCIGHHHRITQALTRLPGGKWLAKGIAQA